MKYILFILTFFAFEKVASQTKKDTIEVLNLLIADLNPLTKFPFPKESLADISKIVPPYLLNNKTDVFLSSIIDKLENKMLAHYGMDSLLVKEKIRKAQPITIEKYVTSQYNVILSHLLPNDSAFSNKLKNIFVFTSISTPVFDKNYCFILIRSVMFGEVRLFKKEKNKWILMPFSLDWPLPGWIFN